MWHMLNDQYLSTRESHLIFCPAPGGVGSNNKLFHARDLVQRDILGDVEGVP